MASQAELWDGEDVAPCPSCTLRIRIIYDEVGLACVCDSENVHIPAQLLLVLLTQENLPPLRKAEGFAGGQAVGVH